MNESQKRKIIFFLNMPDKTCHAEVRRDEASRSFLKKMRPFALFRVTLTGFY